MAPQAVVLDPRATLTAPDALFFGSGMKAVDHAAEISPRIWARRSAIPTRHRLWHCSIGHSAAQRASAATSRRGSMPRPARGSLLLGRCPAFRLALVIRSGVSRALWRTCRTASQRARSFPRSCAGTNLLTPSGKPALPPHWAQLVHRRPTRSASLWRHWGCRAACAILASSWNLICGDRAQVARRGKYLHHSAAGPISRRHYRDPQPCLVVSCSKLAFCSPPPPAPVWRTTGVFQRMPHVVRHTGKRFHLNMLSAILAKGELRFMTLRKRISAALFIEFLRRLITNYPKKIFLVVDGLPAHKAK